MRSAGGTARARMPSAGGQARGTRHQRGDSPSPGGVPRHEASMSSLVPASLCVPSGLAGALRLIAVSGDPGAWAMVHDAAVPHVRRVLLRLSDETAQVEDAVQDALISIRKSAGTFRDPGQDSDRAALRWIMAISVNALRRLHRSQLRQRLAPGVCAAPEPPAAARIERDEMRGLVGEAINELPQTQREVLSAPLPRRPGGARDRRPHAIAHRHGQDPPASRTSRSASALGSSGGGCRPWGRRRRWPQPDGSGGCSRALTTPAPVRPGKPRIRHWHPQLAALGGCAVLALGVAALVPARSHPAQEVALPAQARDAGGTDRSGCCDDGRPG